MRKTCKHRPDDMSFWSREEDGWVRITFCCVNCNARGFAMIVAEDVKWNEADDAPEDEISPPKVGTETPNDSNEVSELPAPAPHTRG
jgi:hypothetical protein